MRLPQQLNNGNTLPVDVSTLMDSTLCDGFDFPVGDKNGQGIYTAPGGKKYTGWIVDKHPDGVGETWNGKGGGDTDLGQPVCAVAHGRVTDVVDGVVAIEHRYVENGKIIKIHSFYDGLAGIKVHPGDMVKRRQPIGHIGHSTTDSLAQAQLVLIMYKGFGSNTNRYSGAGNYKRGIGDVNASAFINAHRSIMVPYKKDRIVIVHKSHFKCYLYEKGVLKNTYEIALAQVPVGAKEKQGDLKVPEGEYQICEKTKGPFSTANNWSAAYLGTRWLCLNYPNTFDAQKALDEKRITAVQFKQIEQAHKAGVRPPQNTSLGGAVGIHGWIAEDWSNDSDRAQTWGCVSFHNKDLEEFYDRVQLKTTVIIIP